ncbi:MAG: DUF4214 domain-containing protein [Actinomycetota bacterium]
MGSAAPFLRRVLSLSLLVVVGAGVLAVWFAVGTSPPELESQPVIDRLDGDGVATLAVGLETGWRVPDLGVLDQAHLHAADVVPLAAGTETVGARITVAPRATIALVNGASAQTLAYRSETGGAWGPWQRLELGDHEGPDGVPGEEGAVTTMTGAGPLWLGQDTGQLEFVVVGGSTATFDVTFIGDRPGREDDETFEPASAAAVAGATVGPTMPGVIPREQWAVGGWNTQADGCTEGPSIADHLQAAVIHHTVTANNYGEGDVDDLLRAIYHGHVVVNGWCDIGYNFVVDRFGRIWEARTGSIEDSVIGGHARGFNTGTVGIALLGQHHPGASPSAAVPTSAAESAIADLVHWKLGIHGVDPAGHTWLRNRSSRSPLRLTGNAWHYVPTVLGHRDLGITSCPGNHGHQLVAGLSAQLAARRDVSLPYRFADWQPHDHGPGLIVAEAGGGVRPAGTAEPWSQAPAGVGAGDPIIAVGGAAAGGHLLTASGGLVPYGAAPATAAPPLGVAAVDLQVRSDGRAGWIVDAAGTLHGFGGAPTVTAAEVDGAVVAAATDDGGNGYVATASGGLFPTGAAPSLPALSGSIDGAAIVDIDLSPDGSGWALDDRGFIHRFGGDPASHRVFPPEAVRAVVAATAGPGGWVLDADGQLWPFGGARLMFPVATDATVADAVDADHLGMTYRAEFTTGDDARYVTAINRLFADRTPTVDELHLTVADLEQGIDREDLTAVLARSEHWSGTSLDRMYQDVLGRAPDAEGRAYWLGEIAAGLNLQDLGTYFYGSSEYADGAGSAAAYVTGLYRALLGRDPDADGLTYWVDLLEGGEAGPPDVANGFYASIESRRDRATRIHQDVMGTEPSGDDRDLLADRLLVVGDAGVAAELAGSSDYYRLVTEGPTA